MVSIRTTDFTHFKLFFKRQDPQSSLCRLYNFPCVQASLKNRLRTVKLLQVQQNYCIYSSVFIVTERAVQRVREQKYFLARKCCPNVGCCRALGNDVRPRVTIQKDSVKRGRHYGVIARAPGSPLQIENSFRNVNYRGNHSMN